MKSAELELKFSCGEDLDAMPRRGATAHCARCDHAVYDLSSMTEREARALVEGAKERGEQLCVSYELDEDGEVFFVGEPSYQARLGRQVSGLRSILAASMVAAPLLFMGCDVSDEARAEAQAPLVVVDGAPVRLLADLHGAAAMPAAPLSPEELELERWRAGLRAKQAERDRWRQMWREKMEAKREASRPKYRNTGIIVDVSPKVK